MVGTYIRGGRYSTKKAITHEGQDEQFPSVPHSTKVVTDSSNHRLQTSKLSTNIHHKVILSTGKGQICIGQGHIWYMYWSRSHRYNMYRFHHHIQSRKMSTNTGQGH